MAMLSALGGVIMSLSFLISGLMYARFHHSSAAIRALLLIPPFVIGGTILALAGRRLKQGIKDGRWPSADVEALQSNFESGLWQAAYIACVVLWSISIFESGRIRALAWTACPLFLTISTLQNNLRRPKVPEPNLGLGSCSIAHLRSEHWGDR